MSVDTIAHLDGKVSPDEILNIINREFNTAGKLRHGNRMLQNDLGPTKEVFGSGVLYDDTSWIDANIGDSKFTLFIHYRNYRLESENRASSGEITCITANRSDLAKKIINKITEHYGGWIDYDDCDSESYVRIEKNLAYSEPS